MAPSAIGGILAGINEAFRECLIEMLKASEIQVIAGLLAGEQGMQSMVKVIAPLGVQPAPGIGIGALRQGLHPGSDP